MESSPEAVADVLPPLCEALCLRLRSALRAPSALPQCKKSLQLLIDLLGCVRLVGSLEQPQIRLLVLELLERLLDPCLADFGSEAPLPCCHRPRLRPHHRRSALTYSPPPLLMPPPLP